MNRVVSLFCILLSTVAAGAAEPGLVGWWRLDDGAGTTAADSSDGGHDGSFLTGVPEWVAGKFGGALKFNGGAQVEIPDHADFHVTDAVSIALWANPEAGQQTDSKFFCKQKSSYYPYALQYNAGTQTIYANVNAASGQLNTKPNIENFPGQWAHLCAVYDGSALILYKDGVEVARATGSGKLAQNTLSLTIGGRLGYTTSNTFRGLIDDVRLYNRPLTPAEIAQIMKGPEAAAASKPNPAMGAVDVPRDVVLSWKPVAPGMLHDVYFGSTAADVREAERTNPKGVLVAQAQDANTYDPAGLLAFGQTYYWRVDEVNTVTNAIGEGPVWSFATEPVAYALQPAAVTASSSQSPDNGPEKTMDGSGLDADGQHSTLDTTMWISSGDGLQPAWIRYDLGQLSKLYEMWVWNSNQPVEPAIGFGAKDVTVEYSSDGETWTALSGVSRFARATGKADYAYNTTVDFGGVTARYVKIAIQNNWGGLVSQCSLSEVRFFSLPVLPREPQPASGASSVAVDTMLSWRAGREAASHKVFFGADANAVADGTAPVQTVADNRFDPGALTLGSSYYWKVVEVNEAETPTAWEGGVWSFATREYLVIDDMETYNDDDHRIYETWIDGVTTGASGSTVGYLEAPFAEKTVVHGGKQSMPLAYDNSNAPFFSEAEREFAPAQNWTLNGADTLSLWVRGTPAAFLEEAGTITLSAAGTDIWGTADDFRFAHKTLTGDGSVVVKVESLVNTNVWAKAGVMIRQDLTDSSKFVYFIQSFGSGVSLGWRPTPAATCSSVTQAGIAAPQWVKLIRKGDVFTAQYSANGTTWTDLKNADGTIASATVAMNNPVYIGLCVTSHNINATTTAVMSGAATTGNVTGGSWQVLAIGNDPQTANAPAGLYLTVQDSAGKKATATNPTAVTSAGWTQWQIPLSSLTGVNLKAVKKLFLGVDNRTSPTKGAGMLFIDDIGFGRPAQ